ncbi:MAG TPA: MXAN_5187 C-terminal domain-containing protein [Thermoanaerobaculia bacterium]|nr:MXAN_5187 C-terminal domain-containing protein [Thermoanaerobaculia bacterium]
MKNPLHERIAQMEETLRKLKNQYDLFFGGSTKLPPSEEHKRFERAVREFATERIRDNTARFRFNNLQNKYTLLREMWSRRMREAEEGPLNYRQRLAALAAAVEPPEPPAPAAPPVTPGPADSYVWVGPETDGAAIRTLHEQISHAQETLGAPALSLQQVASMIDRQVESLRNRYGARGVGFRVEVVNGKLKLKAKPLQDQT